MELMMLMGTGAATVAALAGMVELVSRARRPGRTQGPLDALGRIFIRIVQERPQRPIFDHEHDTSWRPAKTTKRSRRSTAQADIRSASQRLF